MTLTWKVAGAASAQLSVAQADTRTTFEGATDDQGVLRLAVNLGSAMLARLTMLDGEETTATWECDLASMDTSELAPPPDLSGDSPRVPFGSLLDAPAALPLDATGTGGGAIIVDPGPHSSATFTVTITPTDGSPAQTAQATLQVTNFIAELLMPDGTQAPANAQCRLELCVLAGDPAAANPSEQTA